MKYNLPTHSEVITTVPRTHCNYSRMRHNTLAYRIVGICQKSMHIEIRLIILYETMHYEIFNCTR
jgi:hypothetical protein